MLPLNWKKLIAINIKYVKNIPKNNKLFLRIIVLEAGLIPTITKPKDLSFMINLL